MRVARSSRESKPPSRARPSTRSDAGASAELAAKAANDNGQEMTSNLPEHFPVVSGEVDLIRIYFADLIASVLRDAS